MAQQMGWGDSFGLSDGCLKRKNRWLFKIPDISADGIDSLPPSKTARPELSFKELSLEHITETIYYPGKPEWKPITLTLYDLKKNQNPIIKWVSSIYDINNAFAYKFSSELKKTATLELYDGTGEVIESWTFENIWPTTIAFGDLDMQSSEVAVLDLTLRYDRAYTTV